MWKIGDYVQVHNKNGLIFGIIKNNYSIRWFTKDWYHNMADIIYHVDPENLPKAQVAEKKFFLDDCRKEWE